MKVRLPIALLLASLVGCADVSSSDENLDIEADTAALATNTFDIVPGLGEPIFTCDGEELTLTGTFHEMFSYVSNSQGEHIVVTSNGQGIKGTDTAGRKFVMNNSGVSTLMFTAGAFNQTSAFSFTLIGLGRAPNQRITGQFHLTFTPDGDLSASVDHFTSVCQ